MLGYLASFLLGRGTKSSTGLIPMLAEYGRLSQTERVRDHIWDSVTQGKQFMYDLRCDSWDQEEWVFVRLPDDDARPLDSDEITWEEFVELEPSYRSLGTWYRAHHRAENTQDIGVEG